MDSSTGLFYEAGTSIKKASYTIVNVIGKVGVKEYFVSSDKGVFYYDGNDPTVIGTPTIAKTAYCVKGTKDSWTCYYYDEANKQYMTMTQDGKTAKNESLNGETYALKSFYFENINEDNYAVVFENPTTKECYVFYGSLDNLIALTAPTTTGYTDVSYIGGKVFIGKNSEGTEVYFTYDGTTLSSATKNTSSFRSHLNGYYVTISTKFYYNSNDISPSSVTGTNYTKCVTYNDGTYTYFFLKGASVVYMCKDGAVTTKTCSTLANTEVKAVVSVSGDYINIITAENGAKCVNLADAKIENSWK